MTTATVFSRSLKEIEKQEAVARRHSARAMAILERSPSAALTACYAVQR